MSNVPRASTYWKKPEKYREEAREYSKKHYVPRRKKKTTIAPLVPLKSTSIKKIKYKNISGYNNQARCNDDIDVIRQVLKKYYSKNYVSKKIKQMSKLGQVFICQGFCFMPLSSFLQAQANKAFTSVSNTYRKGEQGILNFIPFLQQAFPSSQFFIIFTNPVHQHGIDFLVLKQGIPYCAIELTNYKRTSYLSTTDVSRYCNNLNYWSIKYPDIYKIIAVKYPENLKINPKWSNAYEEFVKNKIAIKIIR